MTINADQLLNRPSELHRRYGGRLAMQKAQQEKMVGGGPSNIVLSKKSIKGIEGIKINVIKIEDIFKGSLALDKKQLDDKKKATSRKRKEDIETKLETKPNVESGGKVKLPAAPRMGILDFVKNFIGNVLLGYFAVRLIKHLPKIMPIVKFLGNATDFIINTGGELLNGLITFAQKGQEAHDKTRGFIKNLGGENFAKGFDRFIGAIDTALFLTTVLAGSMAMEAMSGGGGGAGPGGPDPRRQPTRTTSGGRTLDTPNIRNPLRQKPTVTTGGATPRPMSGGPRITGDVSGGGKFKLPSGGSIRSGGIAALVMLIPDIINSGMLVSQGRPKDGIRTFLSAIAGVGAGMSAMAGVTAGAAALGITGVGIPAAIALAIAGFAASSAASFLAYEGTDALLKKMGLIDNDPKTGKPYAYRSGGVTRGGRSRGRVKRTLSKGKYKRVLAPQKPSKTELKTEAFTKNKNLKESTEELDKTKYFGPILAISSKIMNKEEPTDRDYQNVGLGINLLIAKGIQDGQLKGGIIAKFAGGGLVDPDVLSAAETGGDISNWVAKTFRGAIETGAQRTMRLMKEMREASPSPSPGPGSGDPGNPDGNRNYGSAGVQAVKNFGTTHGYSPEFTAGLLATIEKESRFDPYAIGDSGNSYGLFQFNFLGGAAGNRRTPFLAFLEKNGIANPQELFLNRSSQRAISQKDKVFNLTLEYMMMKEQGKQLVRDYKNSNDLVTIMGGFEDIERYSGSQTNLPRNQRNNSKYKARLQAARDYLKSGVTGTVAPPAPVMSSPLGTQVGNLSEAKSLAESMGLQVTSYRRPGDPGYHGLGRAMDFQTIGAGGNTGTPSQLALANEFVRKYGATAKEIFYTPLGFSIKDGKKVSPIAASGHYNHVHIAFAKGGRIHKPIIAMIGEKGPEFVFDADTTRGLDKLAPQLLEKLNFASTKPQLASILQSYAPYDASASSQTIVVQSPSAPSGGRNNNSSGGGVAVIPIPVDNFTEILAMIG
jgi:hypothetical protein